MTWRARIGLGVALLSATATATRADWPANVDGPDVFGNTRVVAGSGDGRERLVVQCDQKDMLFVAYLVRKREFEKIATAPADLLIQTDGGTPTKLIASLRNWNDNYLAVSAEGRTTQMLTLIQAIAAARGKINIGAVVNGNQLSASFGSSGSRVAMEKVISGCKLDAIKKEFVTMNPIGAGQQFMAACLLCQIPL